MLGLPSYGIEATSSGLKDPEVAHVRTFIQVGLSEATCTGTGKLSGTERSETLDWHHMCFVFSWPPARRVLLSLAMSRVRAAVARHGPSRRST